MTLPAAFYIRDGEAEGRARLRSTALCRGPWSNDHQHGGPPGALLAGALARFGEDGGAGWHVARLTFEILRPVPLAPLEVAIEPIALGRKVQRLQARLWAGGTEVLRAAGLRIRRADPPLALPPREEATLGPGGVGELFTLPFFQHEVGYHRAIDFRIVRGTWARGPVAVWARPLVPLVEGEEALPIERVQILVDAESGFCPPLDPSSHTFVNPDLTLVLDRDLEGEWLGLDIRSTARAHGVGLAESLLFDARGPIGRGVQTLVVEGR